MRRQTRRARMSSECGVASGPNLPSIASRDAALRQVFPDVHPGAQLFHAAKDGKAEVVSMQLRYQGRLRIYQKD